MVVEKNMRLLSFTAVSFAAASVAATVVGLSSASASAEEIESAKLGQKISDVSLVDHAGKKQSLHDVAGAKATVFVFLSYECPISTSYTPTLTEMAKRYAEKGITFVGLCASEAETAESVEKQAREFKLGFPVFHDPHGTNAGLFKAEKTPEAFVLDHNLVLRYRGRIDDAFAARLKKNQQIKSHDLEKALDELLAGKAVSQPVTAAVGCPIGIERKVERDGAVTYYRDVAPILQNRCQECHRPGQVGPFSLMTYRQAVNWCDDLKHYTATHQMPPWKIADGIAFRNERTMTDKEVSTLAAWVDGGTPEGNVSDAPPAREFVTGWRLGQPDLVLSAKEDFVLGPGGSDVFRCLVLPTDLPEDKFVIAYEVKPGNPRIVHHSLNFIDTDGEGRALEKSAQAREKRTKKRGDYDTGPGYSFAMGVGFSPRGGMGGWAPGQVPQEMPKGYGFKLPKKADIVVQVHYHRDGRVERDRLQIGLYFAKKSEGMKAYKTGMIAGRFIAIPPNDSNFKVLGSTTVKYDCVLHSIMPHMHLLGKKIKVTMKPPGGKKQTLLEIDSWDYNWQETYFLKKPLPLAVDTVLALEAVYDNSEDNVNNPNNPPRLVTFGEQTTNEMCFVFLGSTSDGPGRSPFVGPFEGIRRGFRDRRRGSEKNPETKKPAAAKSEPVTKN
jgi:peroxiredoxin